MRDSRGFTLLELLVAFAIFSIIAAALYGSFFVSHKAVAYTEDSLLKLHELRNAMQGIRRELEAAIPEDEGGFVVLDRDVFGSQASALSFGTFHSALPAAARVSYRVGEEADSGRLYLLKGIRSAWGAEDDVREAEVLEEITSFTVEASSGSLGWVRTWDERKTPGAVRVTITAPVGERSITLTETVRPMVGRTL